MREFKLGDETTTAILEDARRALGKDFDGFVQVLITRHDRDALLGVDYRAEETSFDALPPLKLLAVNGVTTILGQGSCNATTSSGAYLGSWELPPWMCGG